jgi:zinc protease
VVVVRRDTAALTASSFSVNERRGPGSLLVLGIANRGVTAPRLDSLLAGQIEFIRSSGVTADELTRAQNQYRAGVIQSRETTFGMAEGLNYYNLLFPSVSDMNTDPQRYMAVTAEDIKRVATKYLDPANATVVIVNPAGKTQAGGDQ